MFKIPDFDDDVPQTDQNYNKSSTIPNGIVPSNRAGRKHKTTVTEKTTNVKTTNRSIVKAKDKLIKPKKFEIQKNVKVNNTSRNFNNQIVEPYKFKKSIQKPNMIQSINSVSQNILETNELVENINCKKKKKSKKPVEIDANWLGSDYLGTDPMNSNKKKQKYKLEEFDEQLLKVGKKTFSESIKRADQEAQLLFSSQKPLTKKEKLRNMLLGQNSHRNPIKVNSSLRDRMLEQLRAAQFRYLNEKLYTCSGQEAQELFRADPAAFRTYHAGYRQQLRKWPVNPLHVIAKRIKSFPKSHVIADMGCGEGALATLVPHTVHGFDLVATSARVTACDMARTPLPPRAVHVAVYCLALMGTQLAQYLLEANRILKDGGRLLVAEVESRFGSTDEFVAGVAQLGFRLLQLDKSHQVFYFFEFEKTRDAPTKKAKLPQLALKPCLYKRR